MCKCDIWGCMYNTSKGCVCWHKCRWDIENMSRAMTIKEGDIVVSIIDGVSGIVIKQYYPTASPQQTMIRTFDGRIYHAPRYEFRKIKE